MMVKRIIQRLFPDHERIKKQNTFRFLGQLLHEPRLWHLNRRSVSGAFAVGLFMALVPFPVQMAGAALMAVVFRVNLAISVTLVWLSNPLTIPPLFYFAYLIGHWILGGQARQFAHMQLTVAWFQTEFGLIWAPLLLGSFLLGMTLSAAGFFGIRIFWRIHVIRRWRKRRDLESGNQG